MKFHFAPVQGHTDAVYRHFHSKVYEGDLTYYTPFIRLEKGGIRSKDLKDLSSPLNDNIHLVPQIIFRDEFELNSLIKILYDMGIREIDLNMGCPFPLQTGHGRGAATISSSPLAEAVVEAIDKYYDIRFSVKMRLGLENSDEWKTLLPYLNKSKLKHITLHPRIAKQQYSGEVDYIRFGEFLSLSHNPVIYNGEIKTPDDINEIISRFPDIAGIMLGRGILGRPSLFQEFESKKEFPIEERISKMLNFHTLLFNHYSKVLCGDTQLISKIQPFWEYAEDEIGRKAWKAIKKASNIAKYQTGVALI